MLGIAVQIRINPVTDETIVYAFAATAPKSEVGVYTRAINGLLDSYGARDLIRFAKGEIPRIGGSISREVSQDGAVVLRMTRPTNVTLTPIMSVTRAEDELPEVPRDQQLFMLFHEVAPPLPAYVQPAFATPTTPYVEPEPIEYDYDAMIAELSQYDVRDILKLARGKKNGKLGGLQRVDTDELEFIRLANGSYVHINEENAERYDLADPRAIGWLAVPAGPDRDWDPGEENIREVLIDYTDSDLFKWVEDETKPLEGVSIGGTTDYLERFGVWPHTECDWDESVYPGGRSGTTVEPLMFIGEFMYMNKRHYLFCGVVDHDEEFQVWGEDNAGELVAPSFAILTDDGPVQAWVILQEPKQPIEELIGDAVRHVPDRQMPYNPTWIQRPEIGDAPFNHYVTSFDSVGEIMFGDAGMLYIFTDDEGYFAIAEQMS